MNELELQRDRSSREQRFEEWLNIHHSGHSTTSDFSTLLCERMFNNRSSGDVVFVASDGQESAHSLVLSTASEVFKTMLTSKLQEGSTRRIEVPDLTCMELRFFLRLLYAGQVDEDDWLGVEDQLKSSYYVDVRYDGFDDSHIIEWQEVSRKWQGVYHRSGLYLGVPKFKSGSRTYLYCSSTESGSVIWRLTDADLETNPSPQDVQWSFSHPGIRDFPPTGTWRRKVNNWEVNNRLWAGPTVPEALRDKILLNVETLPETPPLRLFLSAVKLARKYLVDHMNKPVLLKLMVNHMTIDNFEEIFAGALELDHSLLRMMCLRFATDNWSQTALGRQVCPKYFNGGFTHPGVLQELSQLWPESYRHDIEPYREDGKRRRFLY